MKGTYYLTAMTVNGFKGMEFKSRAELLKFADANKWTKFNVIYDIGGSRSHHQLFEYSKVDGRWSRRFIG